METKTDIRFIRLSTKKTKELAKILVGLPIEQAIDRLRITSNKAAKLLLKAIISAKANAVNNHKLSSKDLIIFRIMVNKGPIFKRWQPVARGMAHKIKKQTSHIRILLKEKEKAKGVVKPNKLVLKKGKK